MTNVQTVVTITSLLALLLTGCPGRQSTQPYVRPSAVNGGEEDEIIQAIEAAGGTCFRYKDLRDLLVQRNRYWLKEPEGNPVVAVEIDECHNPFELVHDIAKLAHIQSVCIRRTALTDEQAAVISSMSTITELRLEGTNFTIQGISELTKLENLEHLNFDSNQTGDQGLQIIGTIDTLKELHLSGTQATDAGYAHLANLKELKYLQISNTKLTDAAFTKLSGLTNLEELSLIGANILGDGLKHFESGQIQNLRLDHSKISATGLSGLANLASVENLSLFYTSATDAGLESLAKMNNLQSLNLHGTSVTIAGLNKLAASKSIQHIDVTSTNITNAECQRFNQTSPQCQAMIIQD